jgi:tRNA(fMet)-specific endonuclease VapC
MSLYVLDTDVLTLFARDHVLVKQRADSHPRNEIAVTVITAEEQLSGWYTFLRRANQPSLLAHAYQRFAETIVLLARWQLLSFTVPAIDRYNQLSALKLNVRKSDLRIAAITVENSAILVTRNTRDFQRVPNLTLEDWTV